MSARGCFSALLWGFGSVKPLKVFGNTKPPKDAVWFPFGPMSFSWMQRDGEKRVRMLGPRFGEFRGRGSWHSVASAVQDSI